MTNQYAGQPASIFHLNRKFLHFKSLTKLLKWNTRCLNSFWLLMLMLYLKMCCVSFSFLFEYLVNSKHECLLQQCTFCFKILLLLGLVMAVLFLVKSLNDLLNYLIKLWWLEAWHDTGIMILFPLLSGFVFLTSDNDYVQGSVCVWVLL